MQATLIAVGKKMPDWITQGYDIYAKRLSHYLSWQLIEVSMERRTKGSDLKKLAQKEGEQMLNHVPSGSKIIALTERGQTMDTMTMAKKLESFQPTGEPLCFLIGGPEGLSEQCLANAHQKWSLSSLTFPHPLVRVILTEQIYRAFSILNHHPYHR